jgi:hypothetical protein
VIYGFSAGGFNALRLCRRMAGETAMHRRQVDLLITVDPCLQDKGPCASFARSTPRPPVGRHVNWYQTSVGDHYSGCSMPEADINRERHPPRRTTGRPSAQAGGHLINHDQMPILTLSAVQTEISRILQLPPKALHVRP